MKVIPQPATCTALDGDPFVLTAATPVVAAAALVPIVDWFKRELTRSAGLTIGTGAGGPAVRLEIVTDDPAFAPLPATHGTRADAADPDGERNALTIDAGGVTIRATTSEGIFRGMTTLLQMLVTSDTNADAAVAIPPVAVADSPRFAWRGLSLDVCRTFFTPDEVRKVIDVLALYKANVLHLHLTDSEGWRLQIDAWPRLTGIGGQGAAAGRRGGFYTKDEYRDLVRYAADRFITVVPEFDMPGHTAAIYRAYPELAGNGVDDPETVTSRGTMFQVMHPDHPRIFGFIEDVVREIADLTPGAYMHYGGDEALGMDEDLYVRFLQRAMPIIRAAGKKPIGWQEAARAGLLPGDIVQLWISPRLGEGMNSLDDIDMSDVPEALQSMTRSMSAEETERMLAAVSDMFHTAALDLDKALGQGANILVSQSTEAYLDTKYREEPADPTQVADWKRLGMPFYPRSTVAEFFNWDPASIRPALKDERIAGVEAGMWAETIETIDDLFFLLLPRFPGLLEKGWSPVVAPDDAWAGYRPRLAAHAAIWERRGWPYFRSSVVWPDT